MWISVKKEWRVNERIYGVLQGLNKAETADLLGEQIVHFWVRSLVGSPPLLPKDDLRHLKFNQRYQHINLEQLTIGDSLQNSVTRVLN